MKIDMRVYSGIIEIKGVKQIYKLFLKGKIISGRLEKITESDIRKIESTINQKIFNSEKEAEDWFRERIKEKQLKGYISRITKIGLEESKLEKEAKEHLLVYQKYRAKGYF